MELYFLKPPNKQKKDKPPLISLKVLLIVLGTAFFVGGLVIWPALTWWQGRYKTLTLLTAPKTTITIGTARKNDPRKLDKTLVTSSYDFAVRVKRGNYVLVYKNSYTTNTKPITVEEDATLATPVLNSVTAKRPKNASPWLASLDATLPSLVDITDGFTITSERFFQGGKWYAALLQSSPDADTVRVIMYHTDIGWKVVGQGQAFSADLYPTVPTDILDAAAGFNAVELDQ